MVNRRRGTRKKNKVVEFLKTKTLLKLIVLTIFIIALIALYMFTNKKIARKNEEKNLEKIDNSLTEIKDTMESNIKDLKEYKTDSIIHIMVTGNIEAGSNILGLSSYEDMFEDVSRELNNTDYTISNLKMNGLNSENKKEFIKALAKSGIDFVENIDNKLTESDKEYLNELGINIIGEKQVSNKRKKNDEDVKDEVIDNNRITIVEKKKVKIAYIKYKDKKTVIEDIKQARTKAEYVIVFINWKKPSKELALDLIKNGANIIIGNSDTMDKMEIVKNDAGQDCLVVYSLGNYITDSNNEKNKRQFVLNVQIKKDKDNNSVTLNKVDYIPYYLASGVNAKTKEKEYKIVNTDDVLEEDKYKEVYEPKQEVQDELIGTEEFKKEISKEKKEDKLVERIKLKLEEDIITKEVYDNIKSNNKKVKEIIKDE